MTATAPNTSSRPLAGALLVLTLVGLLGLATSMEVLHPAQKNSATSRRPIATKFWGVP